MFYKFSKKFFLYIVLFFLSVGFTPAQIKVINERTKESVPFVEIYSNSDTFLGLTDHNGEIPYKLLSNINVTNLSHIYLKHLGYKKQNVSKEQLFNLKKIEIEEDIFELNEVVIRPSNSKKYYLIRGYHRSYNVVDNQLKYFTDCWVEYLYPINSKKKVLLRRLDERFIEIGNQNDKARVMTIGPNIPTIILPHEEYYFSYTYDDFIKKPYNSKINSESGYVAQDYSYISPNKPIILKLFGNETKIHLHHENVIFSSSDINNTSLNNFAYNKTIRQLEMKRKDRDKPYLVDEIREFIVFEVEETDNVPKGFGTFTGVNRLVIPKTKFWEKAQTHVLYSELPQHIKDQLNQAAITK